MTTRIDMPWYADSNDPLVFRATVSTKQKAKKLVRELSKDFDHTQHYVIVKHFEVDHCLVDLQSWGMLEKTSSRQRFYTVEAKFTDTAAVFFKLKYL
ncbi:TPA: hypothetical protein QDB28_002065 [Burkholderia vietnamiensis]|uniref:hypothetical protein n=1 Tax=Burkholderia vietnamiensis TaxID=60552 RepID=UPI00158DC5BD|nr:hypothetical protein [Burkholderia vietnamiensis]HDR9161700.1 hypothetical protein [Burkholderia vietnamiensis]